MKKLVVVFIFSLMMILSSCVPEETSIQTPELSSASSLGIVPTETACAMQTPNKAEQEEYDSIVLDPKSNGYGFLPFTKPEISETNMTYFNPDIIADYLVTGLNDLGGYQYINSAKREDDKLYLSIKYYVYVDPDPAYQYLKSTFDLSDDEILSLRVFSESGCYLQGGHMVTDLGSERDICSGIPITEISLPQMTVADDAVITIQTYFPTDEYAYSGIISFRITTTQFADYILEGKNENDEIMLNNVWFKYSGGVVTGIAEQYAP